MKPQPRLEILRAHDYCTANQSDLRQSQRAGCFYCLAVFDAKEVKEWIPDKTDMTALCPRCGIDSVIPENAGFPLTEEFLREMYDHWFTPADS